MVRNISYEEAIASVLEQVEAGGVRTLPLPEVTGEILDTVSRVPSSHYLMRMAEPLTSPARPG